MKINTYISQTYPFYYENLRKVFLLLCVLAVTSFLFTYLFEPFTLNKAEHKISSLGIGILHASIPIPVALVYFFALNKLVKDTSQWTLGKEFLHLALILLLIGFSNFFLRDLIYTNPDNWSLRYFWEEIRNTFLVGSLLLIIVLPLNLERLLFKHFNFLKKYPAGPPLQRKSSIVQINTQMATEHFELNMKTFVFAKVESNYLEIFYSSSNGLQKYLKRLTIKEFNDQLSSFPFVLRVHRSYLVNLQAIEAISGNAQGYTLRLKGYSQGTIPVSRSNIQEFKRLYVKLR